MTAHPSDLAPEIAAIHDWFASETRELMGRKQRQFANLTAPVRPEAAVELAAMDELYRIMLKVEQALEGSDTLPLFACTALLEASMAMGTLNPTTGSPTDQAVKAEAVPMVQKFFQSLAFQLGSALSLFVRDVPATLPEETQS